jgi:hypothetical protein
MTHVPAFYVKQKITVMVNRYLVIEMLPDGSEGKTLAFAQQKRMSFKEKVMFYTDESKSQELFSFKARQGLDVRAEHDVFDQAGNVIGYFKKDFALSLMRSTWHMKYGDVEATGQERNATIAVLRRIWDFIPVIGEIWVPFLFHFDFVDRSGAVVMSSERKARIRDYYTVTVPDERLDFRVAASMAVALDALQSR